MRSKSGTPKSATVLGRLIGSLAAYKPAVFTAILALTLATAAELTLPIVMKQALDNHLLKTHRQWNITALEHASSGENPLVSGTRVQNLLQTGITIGSNLYTLPSDMADFNRTRIERMQDRGILARDFWYLFTPETRAARELIQKRPGLFSEPAQDGTRAISLEDRAKLNPQEIRTIRSRDIRGLGVKALQYLLLLAAVLFFTFTQVYLTSWTGQKVMVDIRGSLLGHIMGQSLRYLGKTPVGSLVSRVANDVETINEFFTNITMSFLKDAALMAGTIAVLFALDVRLAWISLTALVPTLFIIVIFRNSLRNAFRRVRERISSVNAYLSEHLSGMSTLNLFAAEKRSAREFNEKNSSLLGAELRQMNLMAVFRPLIDLIASVAVAIVIWYSTGMHEQGLVTLGVLIAFVELIEKFFQPVKDIAEKFNILQSAMAGGERIFALMDEDDKIPDTASPATDQVPNETRSVPPDIHFRDVDFSYVPGEPILKGLNFSISPGETVAIVGATGSGKTTVANLLTRFWDPDSGSIILQQRNIRELPLSRLRSLIQPVPQDVFLFAGTIAENISIGLSLSEDHIVRAATLARAHAFISALPQGYETPVTEGASNLSAGQRQLIAFARIIAHNPGIIILDEATANVDTETQTLLQEGLDTLLRNRTALIIAHRLSTIRKAADRILVLGDGKLLEEGTHDELITRGGVYANLYKLQFADA